MDKQTDKSACPSCHRDFSCGVQCRYSQASTVQLGTRLPSTTYPMRGLPVSDEGHYVALGEAFYYHCPHCAVSWCVGGDVKVEGE